VEPEQALQPVLVHDPAFTVLVPSVDVQPLGTHKHDDVAVVVVEVDVVDVEVVVVVVVVQLLAATALHVYVPQTDMKIPHRTVHEAEQSLDINFFLCSLWHRLTERW